MIHKTIEAHIYALLSNAELLHDENGEVVDVTIHPVKQRPHRDEKTGQDAIFFPSVEYKRNLAGQVIEVDDESIGDDFSFTFFINAESHMEVIDIENSIKELFVDRKPVDIDGEQVQYQGVTDIFAKGEDYVNVVEYYVRSCDLSGRY